MESSSLGTAFFVVRSDGTIVGQTGAARDLDWTTELEETVREAVNNGAGDTTEIPGIGKVRITTLHGDGSASFLVAIDRDIDGDPLEPLTVRQREVTWLAISGLSVDEIAWELGISSNTVKYHLKQVYKRLDVSSRLELAAKASGISQPSSDGTLDDE